MFAMLSKEIFTWNVPFGNRLELFYFFPPFFIDDSGAEFHAS